MMIYVWAGVIAASLLIEVFTCDLTVGWFAASGIVAIILAAAEVSTTVQIVVFFSVATLLLLLARPFVKKFIKTETVPTNADANIGKRVKLTSDVVEGRSTIKINGVVWTAACEEALKSGDLVVITGTSGNKYIVEKSTDKEK